MTIKLYDKNMEFNNSKEAQLAEDIIKSGADIVCLQEVNRDNNKILDMLKTEFPHSHMVYLKPPRSGGMAIASRHPIKRTYQSIAGANISALIDTPDGKFRVFNVHLTPYTKDAVAHRKQASRFLSIVGKRLSTAIIAGDFNEPRCGPTLRSLSAYGYKRAHGDFVTRAAGLLKLTIDHVLVPNSWKAKLRRRPRIGSDHYGLLATIKVKA